MAKTRISKTPKERRAELIAAARYLFDKDGVEATRVSDIVRHVGVAQGVFYYYFRSKDEIVEVVVEEVVAELKINVLAVVENKEWDFFKRLSALIELYIDVIDQFVGDNELALPDFDSRTNRSTPVQKARAILLKEMLKLVREGARQGLVQSRYLEWTLYVLEAGICRVALEKLPTRKVIYTLVEQSLRLPEGRLVQYYKPSAA